MEERILKKTAIFIAAVSLAVCLALPFFPRLKTASGEFLTAVKEYRTKTKAERLDMTGLELMAYHMEQTAKEMGEAPSFPSQIRLELPFGVSGGDLEVVREDIAQKITIRIPYAGEDYMYEYPMLGSGESIENLSYKYEKNYGILEFLMEQVYEPDVGYDEDYFYLDFLSPQELYNNVVVIDAGHGGSETGTVKQGVCEKDINLDIVIRLKEMFDASKEPVGVYYTRTTDENPNSEQRMRLAEKTGADFVISVHNNATESGRMSSIQGTLAIYAEDGKEGEFSSGHLAQICLEEVTAAAGSSNKGIRPGKKEEKILYGTIPAVIIEAGFMTNETELGNLCTREYQGKIAKGIYNAVMRAFEEGY